MHSVELYSSDTCRTRYSQHGWNKAAENATREWLGRQVRELLGGGQEYSTE